MAFRSTATMPLTVFFAYLTGIIVIFAAGVVYGAIIKTNTLLEEDILTRARSYFTQIVLTRKWNASYGGVYVEKKNGIESNPWLDDPDVVTADGRIFTLRNPALMTREISELAAEQGLFAFRITSLKPLNPGNAADEAEAAALRAFEDGTEKERSWRISEGKTRTFKYIAPLIADESCLPCHAAQGYKAGDVRGGISVSFDIARTEAVLVSQTVSFIALTLFLVAIALCVTAFLLLGLKRKLDAANARIQYLALTDELTGLPNRRSFMERLEAESSRSQRTGEPFCLAMLDLDHFKAVNDAYGHSMGDFVLRKSAGRLRNAAREIDTAARYGGEEFAVIMPGTKLGNAVFAVNRMRESMGGSPLEDGSGHSLTVTVSAGVAEWRMADDLTEEGRSRDMANLIDRADRALYRAKSEGRDRVCADSLPTGM